MTSGHSKSVKCGCNLGTPWRYINLVLFEGFDAATIIVNPIHINNNNQSSNTTTTSINMKFSHIAILAAGSLVAAQDTTTGGGLISSITGAPSKNSQCYQINQTSVS